MVIDYDAFKTWDQDELLALQRVLKAAEAMHRQYAGRSYLSGELARVELYLEEGENAERERNGLIKDPKCVAS